ALRAIFPGFPAPGGAGVVGRVTPWRPRESRTSHGPAAHFGVACHDSSHFGGPVRPAAPRVILILTVHGPCSRAADTGGVAVVTTMADDGAERLPPRSAATRYRYAVAGASPAPRYDVT